MPASATNDQVRGMLQALLIERFRMKLHLQQKETAVYALLLDKDGPKLTKTTGELPTVSMMPLRLMARNKSMGDLAGILSLRSDRPLVDLTGLDGYYDFELRWDPSGGLGELRTLGLRTEPRKMSLEYLVVEQAERTVIAN
jgi:uncharacterized protein (TIGR03435 family)